MKQEPQFEHTWLQKLVGNWECEMECIVGPDQPPISSKGRELVRSLGGLWTIGEGTGETPEGESVHSVMTLGFDPRIGRFVGTFVASMMAHLWPYDGSLDAAKKVLTLDSEGPGFSQSGALSKYQDMIEFVSEDERTLTSRVQGEDGTWTQFMTARYRRTR